MTTGTRIDRASRPVILLLAVAAALLAGLGAGQAPGWIVGRVTDSVGSPLRDATVTAARAESATEQWSTRTGETGGFQLTGLPAGSYTVRAERAGYRPAEERVVLKDGKRAGVILRLRPSRN